MEIVLHRITFTNEFLYNMVRIIAMKEVLIRTKSTSK